MKKRVYDAEVVEEMLTNLKQDYTALMRKRMKEDDEEKVIRASAAITALGIFQDELYDLKYEEIEL